MDYKTILKSRDYDFLRTNPILKDSLLFLVISGSHSHGTYNENSDIDIRGVVLERKTDLLGITNFEQYVDDKTDTVIYSLRKYLKLLKECNPSIIELLFCNEDHYLYISPLGKKLLDNRHLFLTKRAAYSFGGYANAQLNRLENALARDEYDDKMKLEHINRSIENVYKSLEAYKNNPVDSIRTYIEGDDILIDINLNRIRLDRLKSIVDEMESVKRSYSRSIGSRNHKKDDAHLNKHMMHLIRLYLMCNEILKDHTLHTFRKNERSLLLDIRNGKYRDNDNQIKKEFWDILSSLKKEWEILVKETTLPEHIDEEEFNRLVLELYE